MTNLQWIINHKLNEIVMDLCDTAMTDFSKESDLKIASTRWLFSERIENAWLSTPERKENVQLPKDNEQHI